MIEVADPLLQETDSNDEEIGPTTSTGSWKPQVHFVWNIILDGYFLNDPKSFSGATGQAPFQEVFRVVVDGQLSALPAETTLMLSPQSPSSPMLLRPKESTGASRSSRSLFPA